MCMCDWAPGGDWLWTLTLNLSAELEAQPGAHELHQCIPSDYFWLSCVVFSCNYYYENYFFMIFIIERLIKKVPPDIHTVINFPHICDYRNDFFLLSLNVSFQMFYVILLFTHLLLLLLLHYSIVCCLCDFCQF